MVRIGEDSNGVEIKSGYILKYIKEDHPLNGNKFEIKKYDNDVRVRVIQEVDWTPLSQFSTFSIPEITLAKNSEDRFDAQILEDNLKDFEVFEVFEG